RKGHQPIQKGGRCCGESMGEMTVGVGDDTCRLNVPVLSWGVPPEKQLQIFGNKRITKCNEQVGLQTLFEFLRSLAKKKIAIAHTTDHTMQVGLDIMHDRYVMFFLKLS